MGRFEGKVALVTGAGSGIEQGIRMHKNIYVVIFVVALIAVIVGLDVLFFRHHFLERLMANIGIVLVFAAFGLRFLKK
jgi:uncharacterized membrane protein